MALPSYLPPSTDTIIRSQVHTNHLSNGIDQCKKYGNSMATHCDDVSTLSLSKTWQSIGQNSIKVVSRMQWPHWFTGQIRSQSSKTEGLKPRPDYWQERRGFLMIALVMEDGQLYSDCWVKSKDRKESWKPWGRGRGHTSVISSRSHQELCLSHLYSKDVIADRNISDFTFFQQKHESSQILLAWI